MAAYQLVLYTGTLCHLCDQAKALVYPLLPVGVTLNLVNIDTDTELKARYGFSIPVFAVLDVNGVTVAAKGWPFTQGQIKRMLADTGF